MTDETSAPPAKGEFCHKHFSWLCQAGQGKCQHGEDYEHRVPEGIVPALGFDEES